MIYAFTFPIRLIVLFGAIFVVGANAQTTAFKYQGSLNDAGTPANGSFQMQFKLYDAVSAGTQIGSTITDLPVTVNNGIFGVTLDFGSNPLNGANRWLEIAIRHNSGESYVTLSPREQLTSSPYSVRTISAATADNSEQLGGLDANQYVTTSTNAFVKNDTAVQPASFSISGNGRVGGNFGIGTTTPNSGLELRGLGLNAQQRITDSGSGNSLVLQGGAGSNMKITGFNYNTFTPVPLHLGVDGANTYLNPSGGSVGIGTEVPGPYRLDVFGGVRSFADTTHFVAQATGGTNNWARYYMRTPSQSWFIGSSQNFIGNQFYITDETFNLTRFSIQPNGGPIGLAGSLTQNHPSYGLPHAMLYLDVNGSIIRCYNGVTGSATGTCGFSVTHPSTGQYNINFGFEVENTRFVSVTPGTLGGSAAVVDFIFLSTNVVTLVMRTGATYAGTDREAMVIVY